MLGAGVETDAAIADTGGICKRIGRKFRIRQDHADVDHIAEFRVYEQRAPAQMAKSREHAGMAHGKNAATTFVFFLPMLIWRVAGEGHRRDG